MNTRVMLLLMVSGLFLVVRSGDLKYQQHQRALAAIGNSSSAASMVQFGMSNSQNSQASKLQHVREEICLHVANRYEPHVSSWSPISAECFPDASGLYADRLSPDSRIELTNHRTALHPATIAPSDAQQIDVCIDGCLEFPNSQETPVYRDPFSRGGTVSSLPNASLPMTMTAVKACKPTTTSTSQDLVSIDKPKRVTRIDLPLPSNISPGDYRVVNNRGAVHRLSLTVSDLSHQQASSRSEPRPSYTVIEGRLRWYFIRIDGNKPGTPIAAQEFEESTALLSAVKWLKNDVARTVGTWNTTYQIMIDSLAAGRRSAIDGVRRLTTSIAKSVSRFQMPPLISSGQQNKRRL